MQPQTETKEKTSTKKEQRRKEKEALMQQKRIILEQARKAMLAEQEAKGEAEGKDQRGELDSLLTGPAVPEQFEQNGSNDEPELTPEQAEEKEFQKKLSNKVEIPPTTCLFCHPKLKQNFPTIEENTEHMFRQHGLYIPETQYLVDKKGLIEYLAEKIGFGFCIACNYQGRNTEAAREHMQTKRHMRIRSWKFQIFMIFHPPMMMMKSMWLLRTEREKMAIGKMLMGVKEEMRTVMKSYNHLTGMQFIKMVMN